MEGGQIEKHYELDTSDPQSSFFDFHLTRKPATINLLEWNTSLQYEVNVKVD